MKHFTFALAAAVIFVSAMTGCGVKEAVSEVVSKVTFEEKFTLHGTEYDETNGVKLVYECEVTDADLIDDLRGTVASGKRGEKYYGGEYFLGDIYIKNQRADGFTRKFGYEYVSGLYSWANGRPELVDDCEMFVAVEDRDTGMYDVDEEQRDSFESRIMDYLRQNVEPEVYQLNVAGKKDSLVFLSMYTNWAEDFQCEGWFIDTYGDLYSFDLSGVDELSYKFSENIDDELMRTYTESEPVCRCVCDPERLREIQSTDYQQINQNAGYTDEFQGCDMGDTSLYVCNGNLDRIRLRYNGCYKGELQDDTAKELAEFYLGIF